MNQSLFTYSIHFDAEQSDPARLHKKWTTTHSTIASHITHCPWSPIVWAGGTRSKKNFLGTELAVLDVDNDWQLADAVDYVRRIEAWCLIGTTKSHTPEHHRFRLIMRWQRRIEDVSLYEQNLQRFIKTTPADRACGDGARFYFPCREIVYRQNGRALPVLSPRPAPRPTPTYTGSDDVPPWMADELRAGIPEGRRNRTAFRFAIHLAERKVAQADAREILAPIVSPGFTARELEKAIWSGYRYKRG